MLLEDASLKEKSQLQRQSCPSRLYLLFSSLGIRSKSSINVFISENLVPPLIFLVPIENWSK